MQNKRKICVITGTRAEYGLLYWLMKGIQADDELSLQVIVTGMHLSPEFGLTYKEIEKGLIVDKKDEEFSADNMVVKCSSYSINPVHWHDVIKIIAMRNYDESEVVV